MKSKIRVVAAVFSRRHQGRFEVALFQRKAGDLGGGYWEFPGGKVEAGESDAQALRREIDEELALEVSVGDLLGLASHEYPQRIIDLAVYWVSSHHFNWTLRDHDGFVWVGESDWRGLRVAPIDVALVEKAFQLKG